MIIKFFKSYSEEGKQLEFLLEKYLPEFLLSKLQLDCEFIICDSKGLSVEQGNSPFQVLSAALNNELVIIDGSLEEAAGYDLGVNYECITPAVSSLDNILIVSRTQLPINLIACRTNVASLGEKDKLNIFNNKGGYAKSYSNKQILSWLCDELNTMHLNGRLIRSKELIVDPALPLSKMMQKEIEVMGENMKAIAKERVNTNAKGNPLKQIFISYRTNYCPRDGYDGKYEGNYNVDDLVSIIKEYHRNKGDIEDWDEPFYYPYGVLSNEFMPEVRRWAFVSIPDRKIRECKEFWIFNTQYKAPGCDVDGEVGYWDSWWCLGEFLTIVRMKYSGILDPDFKVMIFNPNACGSSQIEELPYDRIPNMTDEQNRELARYFANGDFLEAGLESMATMRQKRRWSKLRRYVNFLIMKKVVWPKLSKSNDFDNYPFKYFEESVFSHVYDKEFVDSRLLEATHSSILAWRIPWTEEPGGLYSVGLQRVGYN